MASDGPPEVIGVEAVMRRYGLRDRRAARRLMDEAGAFLVGGRLVVRRDDLLAHEEELQAARHAQPSPPGRKTAPARPRSEPLRPGWWRADRGGDRNAA